MVNKRTEYIENLSQFINWAVNLKESEGMPSFPIFNIFFRGHASEYWNLQAGLFREENKMVNEHDCLNVATNRCWAEVASFNNLERLIYFQHFGLLTRLLDVTSNPLVALFFACQDTYGKDGQVRYGYCDKHDNKAVKIIADVITNYDIYEIYPCKDWLHSLAESYGIKNGEILGEMLSTPYYIDAPHNSSRITAQRGALLMSPLLFKDNDEYFFIKNFDFDKVDEKNSLFGERNIIVRHEFKDKILNELRRVGIDEYSIFPDTPHMMSSINKELISQNNRFQLDI